MEQSSEHTNSECIICGYTRAMHNPSGTCRYAGKPSFKPSQTPSDATMLSDNEHLRMLLGRMCDAYKLVCDDADMKYYQSPGSVYAHCRAALAQGKPDKEGEQ